MYSQLPVNGRFETIHANAASSAPPWLAIITGSVSAMRPDVPSATGVASIGTIARRSPKPLAWS